MNQEKDETVPMEEEVRNWSRKEFFFSMLYFDHPISSDRLEQRYRWCK